MASLPLFALPLTPGQPPPGYGWGEIDFSDVSSTTAFKNGLDQRDTILGHRRCVICGVYAKVKHCLILPSDRIFWYELKRRRWIPKRAKEYPEHEPRNGMCMCSNHHKLFDRHYFYIRFIPEVSKFVFVNYSNDEGLSGFHGKAIALDITHRHAPFPTLFIIHEMRVRGCHPFKHVDGPAMPKDINWQDWIESNGAINESGSFIRERPPQPMQSQPQFQGVMTGIGGASSGGPTLPLPDNNAENLAATHAMPSWKACQVEGTSWSGTAEENFEKYVSDIGVEDS